MKNIKEKAIYFDMDGTIANLYAVENWLPMLRHQIIEKILLNILIMD